MSEENSQDFITLIREDIAEGQYNEEQLLQIDLGILFSQFVDPQFYYPLITNITTNMMPGDYPIRFVANHGEVILRARYHSNTTLYGFVIYVHESLNVFHTAEIALLQWIYKKLCLHPRLADYNILRIIFEFWRYSVKFKQGVHYSNLLKNPAVIGYRRFHNYQSPLPNQKKGKIT